MPFSCQLGLADVVWLPLEEADAQSEVWLVWSGEREPSMQMRNMMQLLQPTAEK
ncbi:hypothetical protein [Candidatus Pantoea persica]|uniref:hypothetical protein n=1 Tax=Candidatus Pantoea persica TaxID=2518128 RepID=UPI0035A8D56D